MKSSYVKYAMLPLGLILLTSLWTRSVFGDYYETRVTQKDSKIIDVTAGDVRSITIDMKNSLIIEK